MIEGQEAVEYASAADKLGRRIQRAIAAIVNGSRVNFNADVTVRYNEVAKKEIVVVRTHSKVE